MDFPDALEEVKELLLLEREFPKKTRKALKKAMQALSACIKLQAELEDRIKIFKKMRHLDTAATLYEAATDDLNTILGIEENE